MVMVMVVVGCGGVGKNVCLVRDRPGAIPRGGMVMVVECMLG